MLAPSVGRDEALVGTPAHTVRHPVGKGVRVGRRPAAVVLEPGVGVSHGVSAHGSSLIAHRCAGELPDGRPAGVSHVLGEWAPWPIQRIHAAAEFFTVTNRQAYDLRSYEGQRVSIALADGSRVDDCLLVSVGRAGAKSAWLATDASDLFVPWEDVVEVWAA